MCSLFKGNSTNLKSKKGKSESECRMSISQAFTDPRAPEDNELSAEILSKTSGKSYSTLLAILNLEEIKEVTSKQRADLLLSFLISHNRDDFFDSYWGQFPLFEEIEGVDQNRFKKLFNIKKAYRTLKDHSNIYNVDVCLTKYVGGVDIYSLEDSARSSAEAESSSSARMRKVENIFTDGQNVSAEILIAKFENEGATIKLLCPQKYDDIVWRIFSCLEHEFGTTVTGFVYLIPGGSPVSFPGRYHSNDTFILQAEGTSKVSLFKPRSSELLAATVSLGDDSVPADQMASAYSVITLNPGDSIYCPLGWGYSQITECTGSTQLHIVTNVGNTMMNIVDLIVPQALSAVALSPQALLPLPCSFQSVMGIARSEDDHDSEDDLDEIKERGQSRCGKHVREYIQDAMRTLLKSTMDNAMEILDAACDQHVKSFEFQRLPVPLTLLEESRTAAGAPECKIYPFTKLRMIRPGVARAVVEEGMVVVYHCMDNSRVATETSLSPVEYELDDGPAIEALLDAYPNSIEVSDLPHPSEELDDKVSVASSLFKEGFLFIDDEATLPFRGGEGEETDDDDPF